MFAIFKDFSVGNFYKFFTYLIKGSDKKGSKSTVHFEYELKKKLCGVLLMIKEFFSWNVSRLGFKNISSRLLDILSFIL